MKGILGRKIGMTQVFTEQGRSIPVTVIEVLPNIVTNVLIENKHGYTATQLGVVDVKENIRKKPQVGHFKKANTVPKKFVKEIRNMEGYNLGDKIDASIFTTGEMVDVQGTSKGKGFAGAIKRHNQSIGPKSHGGGGGSKPVRQTGSLGDVVSNRVFKGMTMPGHMGHETSTVQNLEVISIDTSNNILLVNGSVPGPKKGYVVVHSAAKQIPSKDPKKLVNVSESLIKNKLLEDAKKAGADVNTEMSLEDMEAAIKAATESKEADSVAKEAAEEAKELAAKKSAAEEAAVKAHEEAEKAKSSGDKDAVAEAAQKEAAAESQAKAAAEAAADAATEAKAAEMKATAAEEASKELQVEVEEEKKEGDK